MVRTSAPQAPRHLVTTHLSSLIQSPIALGLAFAIGAVSFDTSLATFASALVVSGFLTETVGGSVNWLQGTGDQFAERSTGFRINSLTGLLAIPGTLVITVAVLTRL
jgi:hypothetical protein